MRLEGKKAIITGAADGIGRGIALELGKNGAAVAICDINNKGLAKTCSILKDNNIIHYSEKVDIRNEQEIIEFVKKADEYLDGINVLVNNAAIMPTTRLESLEATTIDQILQVNLRAPILFSREVLASMKRMGSGSIIHMSSVTGHNGFPDVAIYGATKGGLIALARGQAIELAPNNIRVNSVSPGTINSPMLHAFVAKNAINKETALKEFDRIHPRGTVGSIQELANVFVFLASDESINITAEDIRCDGGYCVQGIQPK